MKTYANWGRPFSQMSLGTVQLAWLGEYTLFDNLSAL